MKILTMLKNILKDLLEKNMADEFDMASEIEQKQRDISIAAARTVKLAAVATGLCLQCLAEVEDGRRWCCADCRDDWEKANK